METPNISGPRIREARRAAKMAQVDLLAALEIDFGICMTQSNISQIENQMRGVKDFELRAFAAILGVTADWLLGKQAG